MKYFTIVILLFVSVLFYACEQEQDNEFTIVSEDVWAAIHISETEHSCVQLAVVDLQEDICEITDKTLEINKNEVDNDYAIMVGTIGTSTWIDKYMKGDADLEKIGDQNEAYLIKLVDNLTPNIKKVLVIIGADRRGTMWGIYSLCQNELGIDPMKLWTEWKPAKQKKLVLNITTQTDAPAIPYRGLFINDEWGLLNWRSDGKVLSYENHEAVVETILRLKGNMYCIPMKGKPLTEADKKLIHDRGILHTASHHEILLAKTLFIDWDEYCMKTYGNKIPFSYTKHKKEMGLFFEDAINRHKMYDCIWPVGLRGAGDRAFWKSDPWAPKDMDARAEVVSEGTQWQLDLLKKITDKEYYNSIPKTMTLYSELHELYQTGKLKVPDEAIAIWTDNSRGGVRFPETKPAGKHGVYYHITYCKNHNVQYIGPKMILDEFKRILDFGADQYYLVNVGDIKESMLGTEYTMQLAWDGERTDWDNSIDNFLNYWNSKYFSENVNREVVQLYLDYFEHTFSTNYDKMASGIYKRAIEIGPRFIQELNEKRDLKLYFDEKLNWLHESYTEDVKVWDELYVQSQQIFTKLESDKQKEFFQQNVTYHIEMHRLLLQWNIEVLKAIETYIDGRVNEAIKRLAESEKILDKIDEAVSWAEAGQYKGWYTNRIPNRAPDKWTPIMKPELDKVRIGLIKNMKARD